MTHTTQCECDLHKALRYIIENSGTQYREIISVKNFLCATAKFSPATKDHRGDPHLYESPEFLNWILKHGLGTIDTACEIQHLQKCFSRDL